MVQLEHGLPVLLDLVIHVLVLAVLHIKQFETVSARMGYS